MWLWGCDVQMERPAPEEVGAIAAEVAMNPELLQVVQLYMELEQTDRSMVMMLLENLHLKTKKGWK
jgi:hypothetical protein